MQRTGAARGCHGRGRRFGAVLSQEESHHHEQSLKTLRPGGLAVHTTEFNLSSNDATFEHPTLSLFRKRDIEDLYARLIAAGHKVWPLNLHPGTGPADAHIDLPPYGTPHLKLEVASYVTTSIGLVVEKGGGS